jgi:hypothetical protein
LNELIGKKDADKVRALFKEADKAKADKAAEVFDLTLGLGLTAEEELYRDNFYKRQTMLGEMKTVLHKKANTKIMVAEKKERLAAQQEVDRLARDLRAVPNGGSNHVVPPPIVPPPPPIVPENQMIEDKFNIRGNKGIEILNLNTNADGKKEKTHVGYIQSNELYPLQNQPGAIKALKRKVYNAGLPSALKALKNKQKKEQKSAEKKKRKSEGESGAGGGKKRKQ